MKIYFRICLIVAIISIAMGLSFFLACCVIPVGSPKVNKKYIIQRITPTGEVQTTWEVQSVSKPYFRSTYFPNYYYYEEDRYIWAPVGWVLDVKLKEEQYEKN